jgi:hypothetical protein
MEMHLFNWLTINVIHARVIMDFVAQCLEENAAGTPPTFVFVFVIMVVKERTVNMR